MSIVLIWFSPNAEYCHVLHLHLPTLSSAEVAAIHISEIRELREFPGARSLAADVTYLICSNTV